MARAGTVIRCASRFIGLSRFLVCTKLCCWAFCWGLRTSASDADQLLATGGQAGPVQATHRISCEANPCPCCCSGQGGPPEVTGGHKASAREASPGNHVRVGAAGGHGRPVAATTRSAHAGLKLASSKVRPRVAMGGHNVWVSQRIAPHCGVNLRVDTRNQVALLM
jgi:hypothetical protein